RPLRRAECGEGGARFAITAARSNIGAVSKRERPMPGLHHVTAIAGNPLRNLDFYTRTLGLRLVKRTVNFDDPGTYHFYYGDETGTPGTILTFFPWEGITTGRAGNGMATEIGYSVTKDSLEFWADRFRRSNVRQGEVAERLGEQYL